MELTDNKFSGKLGRCKMGLKGKDDAQLTIPQPIMGADDPSAIRTRSLPDRGVYDEKYLGEPVIWFVAPLSMIHGVLKWFSPFLSLELDASCGPCAIADMSLALNSSRACKVLGDNPSADVR
jgi:hypothetical protein